MGILRKKETRHSRSQTYLFPGRHGRGYISPMSASRILRETFRELGIEGAATDSLRRTALTTMSNNGIPLRIIQSISRHRSLETLEKYLAVTDEQVRGAIASLSHISYVKKCQNIEQQIIGNIQSNLISFHKKK